MRNRTNPIDPKDIDLNREIGRQEEKSIPGESIKNDAVEEEDIIIKCGLDEMIKRFFKDYAILWHDPGVASEENKQYRTQLEKFCKVYTFTEWREASTFITTTKAACHVITSGTHGEDLVKEIVSSQNVIKIYVFCGNKDYHLAWANNYKKISCVETQIQNVLDQIQQSLLQWYKKTSSLQTTLPAFAPIFNDWDKSGMNNLHRYLKVIPNFKNRSQAKKDFLDLSKAMYSDKSNIKLMEDFEKNYSKYEKEAILNWYTKESFLFRVTNNCLRIANSDSIQYCRLVLKDLELAIKEQYREKSKNFHGLLYRAASLSEEEWSHLKANLGREIEMHGFLSVSKDKGKAVNYIYIDETKNTFITILVPKGPNEEEQGFAEVEEFSKYPHEKEVLFNVRTRFTVLETEDQYPQDLSIRHLVLLYGAQGFRKFVAEKNSKQEIIIQINENTICDLCKDRIMDKMFFTPIGVEKAEERYFCKKCLPDFLKDNNLSLLCIPQGKQMKQVSLSGTITAYPMELEIPMYGYKCCKCEKRMEKMYYKCAECHSEANKVWCDDCVEGFSECIQKDHYIILESIPFSFWCNKMSQKEFEHLKYQNKLLEHSTQFQQGDMYFKSLECQKAIDYYKTFIQKGGDQFLIAVAYNKLARVYQGQADYKRAYESSSKALEIARAISGDNDPEVAASYGILGNICHNQAEYRKALDYYTKTLNIRKSIYSDDHPDVATSYGNIARVYQSLAEYDKALEYHSKALEIKKVFYGDNHPHLAISFHNMARIYHLQAKYQRALEYHLLALEIDKSFYDENHPNIGTCYCLIADDYHSQAKYEKALEYHFKALEINKSFDGENHPNVATLYGKIGKIYYRQAEYQKFLEYTCKALEIDKAIYGENHPNVATSYGSLGSFYYSQAEYQKALEYYLKALEIEKSLNSDNHPGVAILYSNLGRVYYRQLDDQKALQCYSKALEILKSFYGESHTLTRNAYKSMQMISEEEKKKKIIK